MTAPQPPRDGWVGPLFRWELVRLARRGQAARARGILTVVVLLALLLFTAAWFSRQGLGAVFFGTSQALSTQESARFGEQFATTFLIAQLFAMILLTPAYAAGGIAEEKERKTFDFLLTSSLANREIVLGKYLGRVVFLVAVMGAGLPILCLTLLYGGVDIGLLLASYALTAGTVAVVAAASLYAALSADGYRAAMFRAYGLTVLFAVVGFGCFYISPLFVFVSLQSLRGDPGPFFVIAIGYPAVEVAIATVLIALAVRRLRPYAAPGIEPRRRNLPRPIARPLAPIFDEVAVPKFLPVATDLRPPPANLPIAKPVRRRPVDSPEPLAKPLPPLGDNDPFMWKERYTGMHGRTEDEDSLVGLKISVAIVVGIGLAIFGLVGIVTAAAGRGGDILVAASTLGLLMQLIAVGSDACGRIALERSRFTLETLLSLPCERREMLFPKLRMAVERGAWWGGPSALGLAAGVGASDIGPAGWPLLIYAAALAPAAAVFGLLLSMRCRSTARAMLVFLPVAGAAALAPAAVFVAFDSSQRALAVWVSVVLTSLLIAASGVAWRTLVREFERNGGGLDGGR